MSEVRSWFADLASRPVAHLISREGQRILVGTDKGEVFLLDRDGQRIWRFEHGHRVESVAYAEQTDHFGVGYWSGLVRLFSEDGLLWERQLDGVVSAVAVDPSGHHLAAGTWSGELVVFLRDGAEVMRAQLDDAIRAIAFHPVELDVLAVAANGNLVAINPAGTETWSQRTGTPLRALAMNAREVALVTAEVSMLLDAASGAALKGSRPGRAAIRLGSVSADGEWMAWVEGNDVVALSRPNVRQGWETTLERPEAIAIAGSRNAPFCMVAQPNGHLLVLNRFQLRLDIDIGTRIKSMSLSRTGAEMTFVDHLGEQLGFRELPELGPWLEDPTLTVMAKGDLVEGQVGLISVDLVNTADRDAHDVEVKLGGDYLRSEAVASVDRIPAGDRVTLRRPVEPEKAGQIEINLAIRWSDDLGKRFDESAEAFVRVKREA